MVYNEQKNVDENCVDVSEILPGKENASIKVRIVRMWKAPAFLKPTETNSLEMVLIDSKVSFYKFHYFVYLCFVVYSVLIRI
jgi:hypothetical protein